MQLEGALQPLLAAAVFWFAAAAGNTSYLNFPVGRQVRWAILAELCVLAGAYAVVRGQVRFRPAPAALALAFLGLAFVSALWSPDPGLTLGRASSLLLLLATGGALAYGAASDARSVARILLGLLAGAVLVAVAGLVVLAVDADSAAVAASVQTPWRYNGLGANPNTMAMLLAVALPLGGWALAEARSRSGKLAAAGTLLLFVCSIVASGSRGALVGALAAMLVLVLGVTAERRQRLLLGLGVVVVFAGGIGLMQVPKPAERNPVRIPIEEQSTVKPAGAELVLPLGDEIGLPRAGSEPFRRTLLTSGGRPRAWKGAFEQARERPLLGYGFGTEEKVFVDRYYLFYSSRVENSYIGTALQLGVAGLALILALVGVIAVRAWRTFPTLDGPLGRAAAACGAMVASGLVLAVGQSYLTSVGSPATPVFWVGLLLLAAATRRDAEARPRPARRRPHRPVRVADSA